MTARIALCDAASVREMGKACSACKAHKPAAAFGRDKHASDGLTSACRACRRIYFGRWSTANPEAHKRAARNWYWRNRKRAATQFAEWSERNPDYPAHRAARQTRNSRAMRLRVLRMLGAKCARCGFKDRRALQIDHINGGGTAEKKAFGGGGRRYWKMVAERGASAYQILCANCNWIKRTENGEVYRKHF